MKTIKLNDLQCVLLSTTSNRKDGSLLPAPDSIAADPKRVQATITSLVRRKLAEKTGDQVTITDAGRAAIGVGEPQPTPVSDDPVSPEAATSGDAGSAVYRDHATAKSASVPESSATTTPTAPSAPAEAPDSSAPPPARRGTKKAQVIELLSREGGATLNDLTEATGWLPHTVRATLSGLRKKGYAITSGKTDGVRAWGIIN